MPLLPLEWLPFKRLELEGGKWVPTTFELNMGSTRDIKDGRLHISVDTRMKETRKTETRKTEKEYSPKNEGFPLALEAAKLKGFEPPPKK